MWPFGQDAIVTGYFLFAIVMSVGTLIGAYRLKYPKSNK